MSDRSPWKPTPWWLRMLGKPPFYRSVQAPAMLGGGWDGFEYSGSASHLPKTIDECHAVILSLRDDFERACRHIDEVTAQPTTAIRSKQVAP